MNNTVKRKPGWTVTAVGVADEQIITASASGSEIMQKFWRKNRDLMGSRRLLDLDWPCLSGIMLRAAEYVTDGLVAPRQNEPVIFVALRQANLVHQQCLDQKNVGDRERLYQFTEALFSGCAAGIAAVVLEDPSREGRWSPADGEPLLPWLTEGGGRRCRLVAAVPSGLRSPGMTQRVHDALREYALDKNEAAILRGMRHAG
jgi:hypothetical protein